MVYFGLIADAEDDIYEQDETNNVDYKPKTISALPPDLKGHYLDSDEPLTAGQTFDVTFAVANAGGATDKSFMLDFYLSDNETISTSDTFLGSYQVLGGMDTGTTPEVTGSFTLPSRGDSAYGNGVVVAACRRAGARYSLVLTTNRSVAAASDSIGEDAWTPVKYPGAVRDPDTGRLDL